MQRVKVLYEVSEGIHRIIKRKADAERLLISKDVTVRLTDTEGKNIEPKLLQEKSSFAKIPVLGDIAHWLGGARTYIPLYKASFKNSVAEEFGRSTKADMNPTMYKKFSEEDSITELMKLDKGMESFMMLLLGLVIGALLGYFLMSGGLDQLL
jgi:hypothetical protein